jgi:transcription initiation factor TFIID subunit 15
LDANGLLHAQLTNGLPQGFYRVCTMVGNENHSPLQMPVAQRGVQDDCKYFSVGQGGGSTNPNDGTTTDTAAGTNKQTTNTNSSATTPSAPAPAPAPASTGTTTGAGGKGGKTGAKNVGKGGRRQ